MTKAKQVDLYIEAHPKWKDQLKVLRELFLLFALTETIKWGGPVYTMNGKNLFGLGAFKNHYAIWLFQGGLLQKNTVLLVNAQEGKTSGMRQIRFEENSEINTEDLSKYIQETIDLHKQGKKIPSSTPKKIKIPAELTKELENDVELKKTFSALSPGKKREYYQFIAEAKREATKQTRLEKIKPMILSGVGLNDRYKNKGWKNIPTPSY